MIEQIRRKVIFFKLTIMKDIQLIRNFGIWFGITDFLIAIVLRGPFRKISLQLNKKYYDRVQRMLTKKGKVQNLITSYKKIDFREIDKKISVDAPIWLFWWQGFEDSHLPDAVKICLASIEEHAGSHPIKYISKNNYKKYTLIPEYIINKLDIGEMSITHFSDILRMDLLARNGGIWMDSTLFLTDELPKDIQNFSFFTIKHGHYPMHICKGRWTGFFLASTPKHPLVMFCRDYLFEYWSEENFLICYLLIDISLSTAYDELTWAKKIVDFVPYNNIKVFELEKNLNSIYKQEKMISICENNPIHKISYRRYLTQNKKTYWHYIRQLYIGDSK